MVYPLSSPTRVNRPKVFEQGQERCISVEMVPAVLSWTMANTVDVILAAVC